MPTYRKFIPARGNTMLQLKTLPEESISIIEVILTWCWIKFYFADKEKYSTDKRKKNKLHDEGFSITRLH